MSWLLERQALELGETAVLLSAFQTAERFAPGTRERYSNLAESAAFVAALGTGLEGEPARGVRGAIGDCGPDDERRFDFALTYDRDLVMNAASSLMRRVQPLV